MLQHDLAKQFLEANETVQQNLAPCQKCSTLAPSIENVGSPRLFLNYAEVLAVQRFIKRNFETRRLFGFIVMQYVHKSFKKSQVKVLSHAGAALCAIGAGKEFDFIFD